MKDGFHLLFGLPVFKTKINPNEYNKKDIVEIIDNNFKKEKERNVWSTDPWGTKIHQSLHDDNNKNFQTPDYTFVAKTYVKPLQDYLSQLNLKRDIKFNLKVINYTASNFQSLMEPHLHGNSEFSMIHYIKFDKNENAPTTFLNPYNFFGYNVRMELLSNKMNLKNLQNSWNMEEWVYDTEEDDLIIFPAVLKHMVKNKDSNKLRITLAADVEIF